MPAKYHKDRISVLLDRNRFHNPFHVCSFQLKLDWLFVTDEYGNVPVLLSTLAHFHPWVSTIAWEKQPFQAKVTVCSSSFSYHSAPIWACNIQHKNHLGSSVCSAWCFAHHIFHGGPLRWRRGSSRKCLGDKGWESHSITALPIHLVHSVHVCHKPVVDTPFLDHPNGCSRPIVANQFENWSSHL